MKESNTCRLLAAAGSSGGTRWPGCARRISLLVLLLTACFSLLLCAVNPCAAQAETITIDVRDADTREVLSALAIKMGVSIIMAADPGRITFKVEDVSPVRALELLLQSQNLAYLREGNVIVVGCPDTLHEHFFKQLILTRFDLFFVKACEVKGVIEKELGLPVKSVVFDNNPHAIWVQGTPQAIAKVRELVTAVDIPENEALTLDFRTVYAKQLSPTRLLELLSQTGLSPTRFVVLKNRLLVFDRDILNRWAEVEELVRTLDCLDARAQTVFLFRLENITAQDAEARLGVFGFDDVQTITFNYPEFSQEILVVCPPEMENEVRTALISLDGAREKIRVPVARAEGEHAMSELNAKRHLISELTGVPVSQMHISRNLSGDSQNPFRVLWVEETPEKVKQIEEVLAKIGG